ncbi:hypothetical protein N0V90_000891 [Kalmusia sp. IMI 367209]|nr:hypothetical protein N0V90_000891 [Kalmusia sp. IMI 367209]
MTYSVILHVPRKPSLSPEDFKYYWENTHVPLLKSLVRYDFPLSHTRHYIERPSVLDPAVDQSSSTTESLPNIGDVDGVAVLTFANKEHYERFKGKLADGKNRKAYEEDLNIFVDLSGLKKVFVLVVDDTNTAVLML